ncbi:sortase, partial [Enterococcus faecium]
MNKNNKTLFNPYVGVIIVFLLFSYFAYQGYLKDKIAEKVDGVTKTIHIQEQAKTYQDNLTS